MLKAFPISATALQRIGSQLSGEPTHTMLDSFGNKSLIEIAESFDVFEFNLEAPPAQSARWRASLRETGQWHHQVRHASDVLEFALSEPRGARADDRLILVTFESELAARIDAAIRWIDDHEDEVPDGTVHLVFIPLLLMHIFWIEAAEADFFVFIDCPEARGKLDFNRFFSGDEFLKVLDTVPRDHPFAPPPKTV